MILPDWSFYYSFLAGHSWVSGGSPSYLAMVWGVGQLVHGPLEVGSCGPGTESLLHYHWITENTTFPHTSYVISKYVFKVTVMDISAEFFMMIIEEKKPSLRCSEPTFKQFTHLLHCVVVHWIETEALITLEQLTLFNKKIVGKMWLCMAKAPCRCTEMAVACLPGL